MAADQRQRGSASPSHIADLSVLAMGMVIGVTKMLPPDYAGWGVSAFGALLGGLVGSSMFRVEDRSLHAQWAISTAAGIVFGPMVFDLMTQPGWITAAAWLPPSANTQMGISGLIACFAWVGLKKVDTLIRRSKIDGSGWRRKK